MKKKNVSKIIYGLCVAGVTASFFSTPVFAGEGAGLQLPKDSGLTKSEQSLVNDKSEETGEESATGDAQGFGLGLAADDNLTGAESYGGEGYTGCDPAYETGAGTNNSSNALCQEQSIPLETIWKEQTASFLTEKDQNSSLTTQQKEQTASHGDTQLKQSFLKTSETQGNNHPSDESEKAQAPSLGGNVIQPSASAFGNIYIDLNGDGETTAEDAEEFRQLIANYDMKDHNGQEISGELLRIFYGPLTSSKTTAAPSAASYYLNNVGQATSVKNQGHYGTCWAFAAAASLESAMLKERQRLSGIDVTALSQGEPVLEDLKSDPDISEKYLAWLAYDHNIKDGAQNEGISSERTGSDILGAGGLFGFPDSYWTSWRGIVNESDEPYKPDNATDSYIEAVFGKTTDDLPERWSLSGRVYPVGDRSAPARANKVITLPAPAIIEYKDGVNVWTGYDSSATDLIKRTLVETGAVAISYAADQSDMSISGNRDYFNHATWAQYNDSDRVKVNHSVAIVGWDDDYPAGNFKAEKNSLPPGNGAWLVKNSWGSYDWYKEQYGDTFTNFVEHLAESQKDDISWGIPGKTGVGTGYFWLSYYDKSISSAMAFGADIPDDGWDHDRIYQYNYYSDMASIPLVLRMYDTETAVANVFTAGEHEILDAVSVRTTEHNSRVNVKVYLLDDGADVSDPSSGRLVSEFDSEIELAGFTTLKLPEAVELKPGRKFAVVQTIVADGGFKDSAVSFLNVETVLEDMLQSEENMGIARSYVYAGAGQTFAKVLSGGIYTWMTPEVLTKELGGGVFNFGNALIKAFTILAGEPSEKETIIDPAKEAEKKESLFSNAAEAAKEAGFPTKAYSVEKSVDSVTGEDKSLGVSKSGAGSRIVKAEKKVSLIAAETGDASLTGVWTVAAFTAAVGMVIYVLRKRHS